MNRILRLLTVFLAVLGLAAVNGNLLAQPKGKDRQEQKDTKGTQGDKEEKAKKHKHENGKDLVGDKIKKNGKHEFHKKGKHTAFVDVQNGKIKGVTVTHAEKGNVPVKKYKTNKKMADASMGGIQPVNLILAQAQYLGVTWIGYSYIDDYGDEVIYWFPYDMIYDGDTGAIEYVPAEGY